VTELQAAVARRAAGTGRTGPGWRPTTLAVLWLATPLFVVWRFAAPPGTAALFGNWFEILTIPFLVAAAGGSLAGGAARTGRLALGWRAVAGAWFTSAIGYAIQLLAPDETHWLTDLGTLLYNAYYPLMVAGLLLLAAAPAGLARRLRALLDVALVLGATALLIWWVVLRGAEAARLEQEVSQLAILLTGELSVLGSAAWLLASAGGRPGLALRLLGAASVVATLADLASGQLTYSQMEGAGRFADAGLVLSAALVASAGLVRPAVGVRPRRLGADLLGGTLGHVPTLAVLATLALLVVEAWHVGGTWPVVALGTASITVLALLALALARRDLEDEAAERAVQAERLAGAQRLATVGHLAGAVAHDFNNLAVAMGEIAAELREAPPAGAADELESLSKRAAGLCRRLLGMARGSAEARPAPHELGAALAGLEPLLRRLLPHRIRVEVAPGTAAWAVLDLAQLELALVNLVVNARDAIQGDGTVTLSAREVVVVAGDPLAARGVPPGVRVVVSVTDDGAGMDAATLARVAEPFFTTKPPGQGTGLGLSLVADMAAAAGGQVVIDSAPGRGTTVRLVLPARGA
jgi:signal transduction histidine kinase